MSALFNFKSFLQVVILCICTCTYLKLRFPGWIQRGDGVTGIVWKAGRIGERKSEWVGLACLVMGVAQLFL